MNKTLSNKYKSKIKELLKNDYNNFIIKKDELNGLLKTIYDKSSLNAPVESVSEYTMSFFHINNENINEFIIKPDRKISIKKENCTKPVIEIEKPVDQLMINSNHDIINIPTINSNINNNLIPNSNNDNDTNCKIEDNTIFIKTSQNKNNKIENNNTSINTEELNKEFNEMVDNSNKNKKVFTTDNKYEYPNESIINVNKREDNKFGPFGTQNINEEQIDDKIDDNVIRRKERFYKMAEYKFPAQKSKEWLESRESKITASDAGCVLGDNKYEPSWRFLLKKVFTAPFKGNVNTYHGNKYEQIATMIYEYRMNVSVREFGLLGHDKYSFIGASPDGIVSEYKLDGKHKTKYVGRMLEIKCPVTRKINKSENPLEACPIYYYDQVLQQLEVCDLDECDFWQCKISEYSSREEFIEDTDKNEPFRSKKTEYEKGCLIQLLPKKINIGDDYDLAVWTYAKFIHPPKIEMSPYECDKWLLNTISRINTDPSHEFYGWFVDRIVYWYLEDSHCVTINRDKKWFENKLPIYLKTWREVEFFRNNKEAKNLLKEYLSSIGFELNKEDRSFNTNYFGDILQKKIKEIYSLNDKDKKSKEYISIVNNINNEIEQNRKLLKEGKDKLKDKFKADKYPNRVNTQRKTFYKKKYSPNQNDSSDDIIILDD